MAAVLLVMNRAALKKAPLCFCMPLTLPRVHTTRTGLIAGLLSACKMHGQDVLLQNWSTHSEQPWQVPAAFLHSPIYPSHPPSFCGWRSNVVVHREGRSSDLHHHFLCLLSCHYAAGLSLLLGATCQLHPALHKCH